ncbi:MAG: hypothetical protein MJZ21_02380 [archaeon]|nr:hypothetical protein [archaeon]
MDSKLIPIIGIIAVVAVVAVGAVAITSDNGGNDNGKNSYELKDYGSWEPASTDVGLLTVFGNANGDSVINSADVELIEAAIPLYNTLVEKQAAKTTADKGTDETAKTAAAKAVEDAKKALDAKLPCTLDATRTYQGARTTYYLADANCDGKINAIDVSIVKKIIEIQAAVHNYNSGDCVNALSKTDLITLGIDTVNIFYYDVDYVLAQFSYPLTGDMAIGYKSNYESVLICGANGRATYACNQVADSTSSYYAWYHDHFANAKNIGSRFTPDYEVFVASGAPQMFVTGTRAWFDANMESTLAPMNVSCVRLPFWEDNVCDSSVVTLGFLICCQESANAYSAKVTDVLNKIETAVKDIPLADRPLVFQSYNGTSISTMHNGIHEAVYLAGGKTPWDVGYSNGNIDIEEVNVPGKMDADFIGLDQYYGFLETWDVKNPKEAFDKMVTQLKDTNLKYIQGIDQSQAYKDKKVFCFNQGTYMGPASYITIAYMFNKIYKDNAAVTLTFDVDAMFSDYLASYHPEFTINDFVYKGVNVQYYMLDELLTATA